LSRLQTDYLDVLLLHNPPEELLDGNRTTIYEELERLKHQGLIRAYGVSLDWAKDLEQVMASTNSNVVEVLFNTFHQEPGSVFKAAQEKGVV
jgi:diketogulonate reductase-like aldo/keto reductase